MDRGRIFWVWLPLLLGLYALGAVFRLGPGPHDIVRWLGLLIGLTGLAGVVLARYTLGRSFSITPQARELVTTGIYSRIRNPIYLSGIVALAGLLLMVRNPHLWWWLVPVAIAQFIRAGREARVLEAKFGDTYRAYRARTWF